MKKIYKKIFLSIFIFSFIVFTLLFNSFYLKASVINDGFSSWSSTDIREAFGTLQESNYNNINELSQLKEIILTYFNPNDINMGFLYNIGSLDNPDYNLPIDYTLIKSFEVDIFINQKQSESFYYLDNYVFDFNRPVLMTAGSDEPYCFTNFNTLDNNWLMSMTCSIYNEEDTILRGEDFSFTFFHDVDFMLPVRFKYHNAYVSYFRYNSLQLVSPTNFSLVLPNGDYSLYARCRLVGEQDNTLYTYENPEYISLEMFKVMFDFVLPLNIPGDIANDNYNLGYNQGYSVGYYEGLNTTAEDIKIPFLYGIINTVTQVLDIEVFPNIKLSYFVWLPLCLGVITLIYHFWRKD